MKAKSLIQTSIKLRTLTSYLNEYSELEISLNEISEHNILYAYFNKTSKVISIHPQQNDEEKDIVGIKVQLNDTLFINSGIKVALDTVLTEKVASNQSHAVDTLRMLDIGVAGLYVNKSGKANCGWDVRAYRRPFTHFDNRPYFRPHRYDYRFSPGQYRGFDRNGVTHHRHPNINRPNRRRWPSAT